MTGPDGQELGLDEMRDLLAKINRLNQISSELEQASIDCREANKRWNGKRMERNDLHKKIIHQYGEKNAPLWIESLHGKF